MYETPPPEPIFVFDKSPNAAATVPSSDATCIICVVFYRLCDPEEPEQTPVCLLSRIHEMLIMMRELGLGLIRLAD